jgi:hypothetical protein
MRFVELLAESGRFSMSTKQGSGLTCARSCQTRPFLKEDVDVSTPKAHRSGRAQACPAGQLFAAQARSR